MGRGVAVDQPFRERGAQSTHNHHGPDLVSIHIHIFTTPAVRVQHEVTVHVIVKTLVQLGHAVAHLEWARPPGNEQALKDPCGPFVVPAAAHLLLAGKAMAPSPHLSGCEQHHCF